MLNRTLKLIAALAMPIAGLTPAQAETAKFGAVPRAMIGLWAWSAQDCTSANADGRIVVDARSVQFSASRYELRDIRAKPDGALLAVAIVSEEGESSKLRDTIDLRLAAVNKLSVKTGAGGELPVYSRCAASSR